MAICGERFTLFLDCEGVVRYFGTNSDGQWGSDIQLHYHENGMPVTIPLKEKIVFVACGYRHSICIDNKGQGWAFGRNISGELGLEYTSIKESPKRICISSFLTAAAAGE